MIILFLVGAQLTCLLFVRWRCTCKTPKNTGQIRWNCLEQLKTDSVACVQRLDQRRPWGAAWVSFVALQFELGSGGPPSYVVHNNPGSTRGVLVFYVSVGDCTKVILKVFSVMFSTLLQSGFVLVRQSIVLCSQERFEC